MSEAGKQADEQVADGEDLDLLREQMFFQARRQRRDVRRLPRLLLASVRLVWSTNRRATTATVALQLGGALVASLQVILAGYAVRLLLRDGEQVTNHLLIPVLLLAVVTLFGALSSTAGGLMGRVLGVQVQRQITDEVLDVATRVPLVDFDDPIFYNQLSRVISNMPSQPYSVVTAISGLVGGLAGAVALTVSLVVLSPPLAAIVLASGLPLWWLARRSGSIEFDFAMAQTVNLRERDYLEDLLTRRENAAETRAYATAPTLRRRFSSLYDDYLAATVALVRRRYVLAAGSALASALASVLAMLALFFLIRRGVTDVASAASGLLAIRLLSARLTMLFGGISNLFQSSLFLDDYDVFMTERAGERRTEVASHGLTEHPGRLPTATVSLRDVSFSYPSSSARAVANVSLNILPGQVVALVGENGSGKTTLAKLMAGLYDPSEGEVAWRTADGEPVTKVQAQDDLTLVLQEFARYQFTVTENIELGRAEREADELVVQRSATAAGIDEVVEGLPDGFDTRLSRQFQGGRDLSLGQWQRLALARAFYRDGSLVVFDEPAASLDPRAERRLYDAVRELLHGRTVILITHRMQSVRAADRIVVMARGHVVEDGDHDTLMEAGGLYSELVTLQATGGLQRAEGPS